MKAGVRGLAVIALALSIVAIVALPACSKKDKSTNPTVTLELNSADLGPGAVYVHTFTTVGQFPYHCSKHPAMVGTITVTAAGAAADSVSILNMGPTGFSPTSLTVGVGGVVTWRNKDTTTHTVTSD